MPAVATAASRTYVTRPRAEPTTTWVSVVTSSSPVPVGMLPPSTEGTTANARPRDSTTLAVAGTARPANGGTRASQAMIRTEASR